MWQNTWSDLFIQGNESETQMIPICSFHAVKHVTELTVYLSSPKWKGAAQTVFSVSEDFWWKGQTRIHSFTQWECVRPLLYVHHMRRSSLGNGSGRPGFSVPPEPVCFLSSALGLYVPSILLFFLMTHSSSSSTKLSRDTNADTVGGINTCIAMLTNSFLRNLRYQGVLVLRSYIWTFTASVRYKWQRDVWEKNKKIHFKKPNHRFIKGVSSLYKFQMVSTLTKREWGILSEITFWPHLFRF